MTGSVPGTPRAPHACRDVQAFLAPSRDAGVGSDVVGTRRAVTTSPNPSPSFTQAGQAS